MIVLLDTPWLKHNSNQFCALSKSNCRITWNQSYNNSIINSAIGAGDKSLSQCLLIEESSAEQAWYLVLLAKRSNHVTLTSLSFSTFHIESQNYDPWLSHQIHGVPKSYMPYWFEYGGWTKQSHKMFNSYESKYGLQSMMREAFLGTTSLIYFLIHHPRLL